MSVLHPLFLMRTITDLAMLIIPLPHYLIQLSGQVKHLFYVLLEPMATTVITFTPPPVCLAHPLPKPSTLKGSLALFFSLSVGSGQHSVRSFRIYWRPANYHSLPFHKCHSLANCLSHLKDREGWGWCLIQGLSEGCADFLWFPFAGCLLRDGKVNSGPVPPNS